MLAVVDVDGVAENAGSHCLRARHRRRALITIDDELEALNDLKRFEEAKALLRKTMPVARRVLGESHELTLRVRTNYAQTLYKVDGATLDDLREAVTTLEETDRIARRVLGGVHPYTKEIEAYLRYVREVLCACEAPPSSA